MGMPEAYPYHEPLTPPQGLIYQPSSQLGTSFGNLSLFDLRHPLFSFSFMASSFINTSSGRGAVLSRENKVVMCVCSS